MCGTSFVGSRDPQKWIWIDTQGSLTHIVAIFKFGNVSGPRATKWPKLNQRLTRSILTKLTYGMGPTSQELPNQLVLQTGHRNTLAKSVPWTPNATNVASGTCCSDLPIWQTLYQPGMVLLPRWTTVPKDSPNQPPQEFTRQQPKIFVRPRSCHNPDRG